MDTLEEATYKHEANPTQVTLLRELVNSLSSGDLLLMPTDEVWHLDEDQQEEKAIATAQDAAAPRAGRGEGADAAPRTPPRARTEAQRAGSRAEKGVAA